MKKKVSTTARILLGLMLIVFGLNKFLMFIPMEPANENAGMVFGSLLIMGVLPIVAILEIIGGIMLLINKKVALTLIILAPIAFNAVLFHATLDLPGIGGSLLFLVLTIILMVDHKEQYKSILK